MRMLLASLTFSFLACSESAAPGPVLVDSADGVDDATSADTALPGDTVSADTSVSDTPVDTQRPDDVPAGTEDPAGLWLEDADGVPLGLLVRRGGDDVTAGRAIYDLVTVYHPASGLFIEVTMTDAVVRYPPNTFFQGGSCDIPVGIGVGPCEACKSAWGIGFLHGGKWYKVRGGSPFEVRGPGSVLKGGLATECVAHDTSNAKVFVVDPVTGAAPPLTLKAPLRFVAR
jgi:hypothetical protein